MPVSTNSSCHLYHAASQGGKKCLLYLAPMVRISTLPMRLLCLEYGADLVYSPEIVDKALIGCERVVNEETGVIEYIKLGQKIFTTHPKEKSRLVLQLGTADPQLALKAALLVRDDVAAIDVNSGCPKRFSLQGGMGAALLSEPDKLVKILETLVQHSGRPVSVKIRVFESVEKTVQLVQRLQNTGIAAMAIHARTVQDRPRDPARWSIFDAVLPIMRIPLIANGDLLHPEKIDQFVALHGISRLLIARGAQSNPSIFRTEGLLPVETVAIAYTEKAKALQHSFTNIKYTIMQMWPESYHLSDAGKLVLHARNTQDLLNALYALTGTE